MRNFEEILQLMIQAYKLYTICSSNITLNSDPWLHEIPPFSRWPPKNKLARVVKEAYVVNCLYLRSCSSLNNSIDTKMTLYD